MTHIRFVANVIDERGDDTTVKLNRTSRYRFLVPVVAVAAVTAMSAPAWAGTALPYAATVSSVITQLGEWITGIIGTFGGVMVGYHAFMRNIDNEPQHVATHTQGMKKVIVGTAIGAGAAGLGIWLYSTFNSGATTTTGMLLSHHTALAFLPRVFGA
jgi:hypothetical protein